MNRVAYGFLLILFLSLGSCRGLVDSIVRFAGSDLKTSVQLISAPEYNFGQVTTGATIPYTVVLKNVGTGELRLRSVLSDNAISATWDRRPIYPDSTAEIEFVYNTKGKLGIQEEEIRILTTEGEEPVKVKFKGFIVLFPMR